MHGVAVHLPGVAAPLAQLAGGGLDGLGLQARDDQRGPGVGKCLGDHAAQHPGVRPVRARVGLADDPPAPRAATTKSRR